MLKQRLNPQPTVKAVDIYAIAPPGEKVSWSSFLGPMCEAMTVVKLTFDNGLTGIAGLTAYTEHEFDQTAFHSTALMTPFVLGKSLHQTTQLQAELRRKYVPLSHLPISLFDIAFHDARGKAANLPIYQLLGAARDKVRAYASSPLLASIDDYIAYCETMLAEGFTAIKIHPRCVFAEDMALVKALHAYFDGRDIGWSLDVDSNYTLEEALKMGRLLDECGWEFFEEPLSDFDLNGYQQLAAALDIDVVNGGNSVTNLALIQYGLTQRCWDRSRFDVTSIGGFTGARQVMGVTTACGMKAEVQSWGYTLTQAANLHVMLAYKNCDYFEMAAPYSKYEFGAKNVLRPDSDGYINPTDLPGLGIEMDWDLLDNHTFAHRHFIVT